MEGQHSLNRSVLRFNEVDRNKPKLDWTVLSVLGFFQVAAILVFGFFLKYFFETGNWNNLLYSSIGLIVYLAFYLLNVFYVKKQWFLYLIIGLSSFGLIAGFYDQLSLKLIGSALLVYFFLLWGLYLGTKELNNSLKIKFWRVSKRTLPLALIGLLFFASIALYLDVNDLIWKNPSAFFVSETIFEKIISPFEPVFQKFFPEFRFSSTIDEFSSEMAMNQTNKDPNAQKLTQAEKTSLVKELTQESEDKISELTGMQVAPSSTLSHVFYQTITKKISELPQKPQNSFPLVAAITIFLALWAFIWLFRWIATFVSMIIYEIFLAFGIAMVSIESTSREIIGLSGN